MCDGCYSGVGFCGSVGVLVLLVVSVMASGAVVVEVSVAMALLEMRGDSNFETRD